MTQFSTRTHRILAAALKGAENISSDVFDVNTPFENILLLDIPEITDDLFSNEELLQESQKVETECYEAQVIEADCDETRVADIEKPNEDAVIPSSPIKDCSLQDSRLCPQEHNGNINEASVNTETSIYNEENIRPIRTRKKKHLVDKDCWKENQNKIKREKGQEYLGRKKEDGIWSQIKKSKRKMGPRCCCKLSTTVFKKSQQLQCYKLTEEDRHEIFTKFWDRMNWSQRRTFVNLQVKNEQTKRHRNRVDEQKSRRNFSSKYFLNKGEDSIRVCKRMFLSTIGMGERMINIWKYSDVSSKAAKAVSSEAQADNPTNVSKRTKMKECLKEFFNALPKMESHYCRKNTSKLYLERTWKSKSELYKCYKNIWCKENNYDHLSIASFSYLFDELNLALFTPKKDECDKCVSYRSGNLSEKLYQIHQEKKTEAREAKDADKVSDNHVFCMDLQAVLLSPKSNVSSLYFKTKLMVHNFTIYNMKTKDAYCFIWHEAAGGVTANIYATIICYFIKDCILKTVKPNESIILWSDGCTSQNRNSTLANALLNMAVHYHIQIEQKFLEKGHTQMEADSIHSAIERKLKKTDINVPADYVGVCLQAREHPRPYIVKYLDYSFFKNFDDINFLKSLRPGRKVGDPVVTDIRAIKYLPDERILYKLRHPEEYCPLEYRHVPKPASCSFEDLPSMYQGPIAIKSDKFEHLQILKMSLLPDYHKFYDELIFK